MKIFLSLLALLSSTSVVMAQPPTTMISLDGPDGPGDFSNFEPDEEPITELEVENSVLESWRYPIGKPLSDMERHWWISRAYFKVFHKYAFLCVVHGQGGKDHYPVVEVYSQTETNEPYKPDPQDGSPNFSCPSQRKPHQHIDDVNTKLEGELDKLDFLWAYKLKKTKPWSRHGEHGLHLTCWIIKFKPEIVDSAVFNPNDGGVTGYYDDKPSPFASFCFRIILQNNNDFLPYHTIDAAEDRDGGRYLQDTAETPDTADSKLPPPPVYTEPDDNMDITYCETGITIYFDLKADFWVRGFKTQAMTPDERNDEVNFKLRAYVGKCYDDWDRVYRELDYYDQLPSLEDAEAQEDLENEGDEGGRRLRRLQEETVVDSYSSGYYRKFWQKEEVPLCICTKKHSLAFIDHIKNLRFYGKRKGHVYAEQTVVWKGQHVKKLVDINCDKHYGKCCEVRVILNEDFFQGDEYKSTLFVHAHGDAWMQVGEKDYYGEAPSRKLVQASFGGRNLQELEAPADGSAGEAEFEVVAELQASGSFAMVGGSALGAIASMIVAVLFV